MFCTLTVFSLDVGGAERVLRRSTLSNEAVEFHVAAPAKALAAMLPVGGTWPCGFRVTDARGRVRVAHTGPRRARSAG